MATFPKSEAEIAALADRMVNGLAAAADDFPNPPVPPEQLRASLERYTAAKNAVVAAQAQASDTYAAKDEALETMSEEMKSDLRYAEGAVANDDQKLERIGWSGPRPRTPLQVPGQIRSLEVLREGQGWVILDWKEPGDGGKVSAYRVRCRRHENSPWRDVGMALDTEIFLNDQERGVELAYQVVAVNKAGSGEPSTVMSVVL